MEKKRRNWIIIIAVVLAILLYSNYKGISLDFKEYGHGSSGQNSFTSLLRSLGITSDPDVTIDGEDMCLNYGCWDRAETAYDECIYVAEGGELELSGYKQKFELPNFFIIPSAAAIVTDLPEVDYSECEAEYDRTLSEECRVACSEETYVWDGTRVTDVGNFYATNYPIFYANSEARCNSWVHEGTWISTPNKIGCTDFLWFMEGSCTSPSIGSAGVVCEAVDGTFICEDGDISCNLG